MVIYMSTCSKVLQTLSMIIYMISLCLSGCGKSTLLNALAGRSMRDMRVKGEICANGQELGRDIAHIASYIQQEDLFIGTLTVRETLLFQVFTPHQTNDLKG